MKVIVAEQVKRFLIAEKNYLRKYSATAHRTLAQRFREAAGLLSSYPFAGTERSLPIRGIRRFVVDDYVLDYEVVEDKVHILNMRHGRQQDPYLPIDEDFDFEDDSSGA